MTKRLGCVAAANQFCKQNPGWKPLRLSRERDGIYWEHVVVTDGKNTFDPSPWNDHPDEEKP